MMAVEQPSGAWWKQLSDLLHERTHHRLRGLQIRAVGGRVSIQASAPSDRVRNQAEEAAREVVPDGILAMRIKVVGTIDRVAPDSPEASEHEHPRAELPKSDRRIAPSLFAGQVVYRRLRRLVSGN
jgi:hypothetical protein